MLSELELWCCGLSQHSARISSDHHLESQLYNLQSSSQLMCLGSRKKWAKIWASTTHGRFGWSAGCLDLVWHSTSHEGHLISETADRSTISLCFSFSLSPFSVTAFQISKQINAFKHNDAFFYVGSIFFSWEDILEYNFNNFESRGLLLYFLSHCQMMRKMWSLSLFLSFSSTQL